MEGKIPSLKSTSIFMLNVSTWNYIGTLLFLLFTGRFKENQSDKLFGRYKVLMEVLCVCKCHYWIRTRGRTCTCWVYCIFLLSLHCVCGHNWIWAPTLFHPQPQSCLWPCSPAYSPWHIGSLGRQPQSSSHCAFVLREKSHTSINLWVKHTHWIRDPPFNSLVQ